MDVFAEWLPRVAYACIALFVIAQIAVVVMQIAAEYAKVLS